MLLLLALSACRDIPDIAGTPWDVPVLVSDASDPWHRCAPDREVRVGCTIDGDTFDIGGCGGTNERFRMLGIDAPETEKPGTPADCWGPEASVELSRLISGRSVTLSYDRVCTDPFARTLAYVWMDVSEALDLFAPSLLDDVLDETTSDVGDTDEQEPVRRVLLNEYLLLAGWVKRYDEDWVEPLSLEADLIAAERLAQVRRQGLWGRCDP